ncbi:hypothetical protein M23134_03257 [Microscilla marina ATCC 23134]|uniref:Uncharacterized protein n=2 Tax=Microscilla marina TaxID=1027 RepID=A1ZGK2_MICM2|nr:hypothetical protein M23134_03257 [Microscilla marina ATCC 23134]
MNFKTSAYFYKIFYSINTYLNIMANLLLPSDISWLTIKHHSLEDILQTLQLTDPMPLSWNTGVCTILSDYWDTRQTPDSTLTRVYVSAPLDGWVFVFGDGIFVKDIEHPIIATEDRSDIIQSLAQQLSTVYGSVAYFTSQPRRDWFEWMWLQKGEVKRYFEWNDGDLQVQGSPILDNETTLIEQATANDSVYWEDVVFEVLEKVCINPETVNQRVTKGVLATTPYGKKVGVPPQPVLDL